MPVQALSQIDPKQFFNLASTAGTGIQRLDTKVGGVAVFNDFSGRLSAYSAESGRRFRANPATPRSPATQGLSDLS